MEPKGTYKILEEKNVIDDHLLDIIGNEFKFDHEKGLSEWLKNSVDAYIRINTPDSKQSVIFRFTDGKKEDGVFECIDFVGMTSLDIDKALKRWGDPEAAKRGLNKKTYGGHGNGGKFYMRQMFDKSHFITYKDGLINVFGFNQNRKYGFASGFKNKKVSVSGALKIAGLKQQDIPPGYYEKIKNNKAGFTVVKGLAPHGMKNIIKANRICGKLKKHPQAMRLLERIDVKIIHNGRVLADSLKPEKITPLEEFKDPIISDIPEKLTHISSDGEKKDVYLSNKKYQPGKLILRTSEIALTQNSKFSELNRIDIIGELGVIASYQLRELGLYYPQTDFIYGECECPILEDPHDDCVKNDRTKLTENLKTDVLLGWIKDNIKKLCEDISKKEEKEREDINKKISSDFNNFLNQWKNRFMSRVLSEVLVGPGEGPGGGTGTEGSFGDFGSGKGNGEKNGGGEGEKEGGGATPKKGVRFPRVLLSGYDEDPLNPGRKLFLQIGHGLIYQRAQDVKEGIYWINTTSPLAEAILNKYDANSPRWRDYLFQRYVDIFIKEALIKLEKKEPDRFNSSTIDGDIMGKLVLRIHEAASKDLNGFLFDERYKLD